MRHAGKWLTVNAQCGLITIGESRFQGQSVSNQLGTAGRRLLMPALRAALSGESVRSQNAVGMVLSRPVFGPDGVIHGATMCLVPNGTPEPPAPNIDTWTVPANADYIHMSPATLRQLGIDPREEGKVPVVEVLSNLPTTSTDVITLIGMKAHLDRSQDSNQFYDYLQVHGQVSSNHSYVFVDETGGLRGLAVKFPESGSPDDAVAVVPPMAHMVPGLTVVALDFADPRIIYTSRPGQEQPEALTDLFDESAVAAVTELLRDAQEGVPTASVTIRMAQKWGGHDVEVTAMRYATLCETVNRAVLLTVFSVSGEPIVHLRARGAPGFSREGESADGSVVRGRS